MANTFDYYIFNKPKLADVLAARSMSLSDLGRETGIGAYVRQIYAGLVPSPHVRAVIAHHLRIDADEIWILLPTCR
ncbi:MAG: hypothetical protein JWN44_2972 [Myxococcales bacterium]|nr:hypothetical protein [Myxococcales bacterium]